MCIPTSSSYSRLAAGSPSRWTCQTDTVGHVVQMLGVPLTEVGALRVDG